MKTYEEFDGDFTSLVGDEQLNMEKEKMNKLKSVWKWLANSSINSNNWALTVKAGVPFLVLLGLGETDVTELIGVVGNTIGLVGQIVAGILTTWGLVRKIYISLKN